MRLTNLLYAIAAIAATTAGAPRALAQEAASAPAAEESKTSVNVDVGVESAYIFRGLNVFKSSGQMDQHAFLAPSATVKLPSGLSFAYWGAYQIVGDNVSAALDGGAGGENDLTVGYDRALAKDLNLGVALTWYVYPFAKKAAGVVPSLPSYLEPAAKVTWSTVADLSLRVLYFGGVQDELKAFRYLYINPAAAKSVELTKDLKLDLGLGLGIKAGSSDLKTALNGNTVDVLASAALPIHVGEKFYVKPNLNFAWTNVDKDLAATPIKDAAFGDGFAFFGGVNLGADL